MAIRGDFSRVKLVRERSESEELIKSLKPALGRKREVGRKKEREPARIHRARRNNRRAPPRSIRVFLE